MNYKASSLTRRNEEEKIKEGEETKKKMRKKRLKDFNFIKRMKEKIEKYVTNTNR